MEQNQDSVPSRSVSTSLLRGAKGKDQDSWERLVGLFHLVVYRWMRRWGVPESDAPDLVQNVFVSVHSAIGRFDREAGGTSFRGWLWRISQNKANDYFRHQNPLQAESAMLAAVPNVEDDPETQNENVELLHRVLEMISTNFSQQTIDIFRRCTFEVPPVLDPGVMRVGWV